MHSSTYLSYSECDYAAQDDKDCKDLHELEYPCEHPRNYEHTCPHRNKKPDQRTECNLLKP